MRKVPDLHLPIFLIFCKMFYQPHQNTHPSRKPIVIQLKNLHLYRLLCSWGKDLLALVRFLSWSSSARGTTCSNRLLVLPSREIRRYRPRGPPRPSHIVVRGLGWGCSIAVLFVALCGGVRGRNSWGWGKKNELPGRLASSGCLASM